MRGLPGKFSLLMVDFRRGDTIPCFGSYIGDKRYPSGLKVITCCSGHYPCASCCMGKILHILTRRVGVPLGMVGLRAERRTRGSPAPTAVFSLFCGKGFMAASLDVYARSGFAGLLG